MSATMQLSDKFFDDGEHVKCECGTVFVTRSDRWSVRCPQCGNRASLHELRCEWRQRQPNAALDDARRNEIMARAN